MTDKTFAICGFGLVGQRHVEAAKVASGLAITSVVDPEADARAKATAQGLHAFDSLEAMFEAQPVDGVIIATPTALHLEHARAALLNDCPVLVEKPVATSSQDAQELVALSEARDVPVLVGHHRRHNPLIAKAHALISAGQLGRIRAVSALCWFYKPDDYFEVAPWRQQPGAGPISVNLAHDVDLLRYLCGEVVRVSAQSTPSMRGHANEDVAAAVLTFENGAIATITVSDAVAAPWSWEMTAGEYPIYPHTDQSCYLIGGSKASLSVPDLRIWSHDGDTPDWWTPISGHAQTFTASNPLVNQLLHFRDLVDRKVSPLVSAQEGQRTLAVIEAIQASAAQNKIIELSQQRGDQAAE